MGYAQNCADPQLRPKGVCTKHRPSVNVQNAYFFGFVFGRSGLCVKAAAEIDLISDLVRDPGSLSPLEAIFPTREPVFSSRPILQSPSSIGGSQHESMGPVQNADLHFFNSPRPCSHSLRARRIISGRLGLKKYLFVIVGNLPGLDCGHLCGRRIEFGFPLNVDARARRQPNPDDLPAFRLRGADSARDIGLSESGWGTRQIKQPWRLRSAFPRLFRRSLWRWLRLIAAQRRPNGRK